MLIEKRLVISPFNYGALLMFNPAVLKTEEKVFLWARTMYSNNKKHYVSYITLLESENGIDFKFKDIKLYPNKNYDKFGCEDPRATKIDEKIYLTYVALEYGAWNGTSRTALVEIKDPYEPEEYKKLGVITWDFVDDKDVLLFPEKIGGKYFIVHRPNITKKNTKIVGGELYVKFGKFGYKRVKYKIERIPEKQSIWLAETSDFKIRESKILYEPEEEWESLKVGGGAPPIKITEGWLLIYHGVQEKNRTKIYRAGVLLLDKKNPYKIVGRYGPILEPTEPWEKYGEVNFVTFPTGAFIEDNELWIYYGAADKRIGLARYDLDKLIDKMV